MRKTELRSMAVKHLSRAVSTLRIFGDTRRIIISDGRYTVRLARNISEVRKALELRHSVFNLEMGRKQSVSGPRTIDLDEFDAVCRHLVVIENTTGRTVGTYRINTIETAIRPSGFYSYNEFDIEELPAEILEEGIEIGRACIAAQHRNSKVLYLLWKGLATVLKATRKRYLFGCCSLFTIDEAIGRATHHQLEAGGHYLPDLMIRPKANGIFHAKEPDFDAVAIELPALFNMYLRVGAKVCSPPMLDHEFGTIDFFVVFDLEKMNAKYRKMFFGDS